MSQSCILDLIVNVMNKMSRRRNGKLEHHLRRKKLQGVKKLTAILTALTASTAKNVAERKPLCIDKLEEVITSTNNLLSSFNDVTESSENLSQSTSGSEGLMKTPLLKNMISMLAPETVTRVRLRRREIRKEDKRKAVMAEKSLNAPCNETSKGSELTFRNEQLTNTPPKKAMVTILDSNRVKRLVSKSRSSPKDKGLK